MILFTSGFPYAGKTELVSRLCEQLDHKNLIHINPRDLYPEDFADLPNSEQQANGIVAWEMSYEKARECITKLPNKVLIVFDTCCRDALQVNQLFGDAKTRGHKILFAYVNASTDRRQEYAEDKDISKFEERYSSSFQQNLPKFKSMSDQFLVINNNKSLLELDERAVELAEKVIELRS